MPEKPIEKVTLAATISLAALLRLLWPGMIEYKLDDALIQRQALALLEDGIWPTGVLSHVFLPHPPIIIYLQAIPYAVSRNPAGAALLMGLLGVGAVGLTYLFAREFIQPPITLLVTMQFAVAPWAVFFSRKLWTQNIPFFTVAFMLCLYLVLVRSRAWAILPMLIALGVLCGTYLGDIVFIGVLVAGLILYPGIIGSLKESRAAMLWLTGGAVCFALLSLPYLMEFLGGHTDLAEMFHTGPSREFMPPYILQRLQFAAHAATGYQFHALAGDKYELFNSTLRWPALDVLNKIQLWLYAASMSYVVVKACVLEVRRVMWRVGSGEPAISFIALWIVFSLAMMVTMGLEVEFLHRYIMLYPVAYVCFGVVLSDSLAWLSARSKPANQALQVVAVIWVLSVGAWQTYQYLAMQRFVARETIYGGHGTPVREAWGTAQIARTYAQHGNIPIVVYTTGADPDQDGGAAMWDAFLGDLPLKLVGDDSMVVTPSDGFVAIYSGADGTYRIEYVDDANASNTGEPLARFANGADLMRYEPQALLALINPGERVRVIFYWEIRQVPSNEIDFSYTAQLFTCSGERLGQADSHFLRTPYWQSGDSIRTSVSLPVTEHDMDKPCYDLLVAMYRYVSPNEQNGVDILDAAGNPAGQYVTFRLD